MNNIIEPNKTFDFLKLSLAHPVSLQGGAYFTKIEFNNKPLYIQTNKGQTKQGFVKSGKKYYCDLLFDKNSDSLINWFENLEETCQKLLFEKSELWFQNTLEQSDIENAFNQCIRLYNSGKLYLLRTYIKNLSALNIFNEQEISLTVDDINSKTNIISILEIQGIKFTSRNFQIEIELRQIMVLDNQPIFDNCLIKTNNKYKTLEEEEHKINLEKQDFTPIDKPNTLDLVIDDLNDEIKESDELKEIDTFDLENNSESITLKNHNQVYFEIYKEARNKAKIAKKNALLAYLEAKKIKKTYLIDILDDCESEIDAEIDEVSESELDGL